MIKVSRLDGVEYYINPHQIESIEVKPDTTLLMLSGKHVIVRDKVDEIIEKIITYRKKIGVFGNDL
ncbi:MAG: flagellar FlbD family protein [Spirochaetaceae bacterium]|jgi:flagellar protein FlbD|nr:flagellar FlbD family protein [Spirochaetaceae bacterium]